MTRVETSIMFVQSQDVVSTDIGEGTALLDMATNTYFSLNEVGAFIWSLLATPRTRFDLLDAVTSEFEVGSEACAADIDRLIGELRDAALIRTESRAV